RRFIFAAGSSNPPPAQTTQQETSTATVPPISISTARSSRKSITEPTRVTQRQFLVNRAKRRHTHEGTGLYQKQDDLVLASNATPQLPSLDVYRRQVSQHVKQALADNGVDITQYDPQMYSCGLPTSADAASVSAWNVLLNDPLLASADVVSSMMAMENPSDHTDDPDRTIFYVRTFAMEARELAHTVQEMQENGYDYIEKLFAWGEMIRNLEPEAIVCLRYVSQTTRSARLRHQEDLSNIRDSFAIRYLNLLESLYPEVIEAAVVQEVDRATITIPVGQQVKDMQEQYLIALFGDSVLNADVEGERHLPITDAAREAFELLNTNMIPLLANTKPCSDATTAAVVEYVGTVEQYANSHPFSTATNLRPFTKALEETYSETAFTRVMHNDFTPMVTIVISNSISNSTDYRTGSYSPT
ncbi:hypothetical protein LTS18_012428, partial [Coniosporium uncinatum]